MGHRTNLVIVDESGFQNYRCSWCAIVLEIHMFWGPEIAIDYIKQHEPLDWWYDEILAEGGAVIDTTQKTLLFYGGENVLFDIPLRRLYLQMIQQVWTGWTIKWAYNGVLDIVDYVGASRENVLRYVRHESYPRARIDSVLVDPSEDDEIDVIASIRLADNTIRLATQPGWLGLLLPYGDMLVDEMRILAEFTELIWFDHAQDFPKDGFHLDLPKKRLSFWSSIPHPVFAERIRVYWSGWELQWLYDNFEAHVALTENRLHLTIPSTEKLLDRLRAVLLQETVIGHFKKFPPPLELRTQIFDDAVARWKAMQNGG
jgi:hypothetical protein